MSKLRTENKLLVNNSNIIPIWEYGTEFGSLKAEDGIQVPKHVLPEQETGDDGNGSPIREVLAAWEQKEAEKRSQPTTLYPLDNYLHYVEKQTPGREHVRTINYEIKKSSEVLEKAKKLIKQGESQCSIPVFKNQMPPKEPSEYKFSDSAHPSSDDDYGAEKYVDFEFYKSTHKPLMALQKNNIESFSLALHPCETKLVNDNTMSTKLVPEGDPNKIKKKSPCQRAIMEESNKQEIIPEMPKEPVQNDLRMKYHFENLNTSVGLMPDITSSVNSSKCFCHSFNESISPCCSSKNCSCFNSNESKNKAHPPDVNYSVQRVAEKWKDNTTDNTRGHHVQLNMIKDSIGTQYPVKEVSKRTKKEEQLASRRKHLDCPKCKSKELGPIPANKEVDIASSQSMKFNVGTNTEPRVNTAFVTFTSQQIGTDENCVSSTSKDMRVQELPKINIRPQLTKRVVTSINIPTVKELNLQAKNNVAVINLVHATNQVVEVQGTEIQGTKVHGAEVYGTKVQETKVKDISHQNTDYSSSNESPVKIISDESQSNYCSTCCSMCEPCSHMDQCCEGESCSHIEKHSRGIKSLQNAVVALSEKISSEGSKGALCLVESLETLAQAINSLYLMSMEGFKTTCYRNKSLSEKEDELFLLIKLIIDLLVGADNGNKGEDYYRGIIEIINTAVQDSISIINLRRSKKHKPTPDFHRNGETPKNEVTPDKEQVKMIARGVIEKNKALLNKQISKNPGQIINSIPDVHQLDLGGQLSKTIEKNYQFDNSEKMCKLIGRSNIKCNANKSKHQNISFRHLLSSDNHQKKLGECSRINIKQAKNLHTNMDLNFETQNEPEMLLLNESFALSNSSSSIEIKSKRPKNGSESKQKEDVDKNHEHNWKPGVQNVSEDKSSNCKEKASDEVVPHKDQVKTITRGMIEKEKALFNKQISKNLERKMNSISNAHQLDNDTEQKLIRGSNIKCSTSKSELETDSCRQLFLSDSHQKNGGEGCSDINRKHVMHNHTNNDLNLESENEPEMLFLNETFVLSNSSSGIEIKPIIPRNVNESSQKEYEYEEDWEPDVPNVSEDSQLSKTEDFSSETLNVHSEKIETNSDVVSEGVNPEPLQSKNDVRDSNKIKNNTNNNFMNCLNESLDVTDNEKIKFTSDSIYPCTDVKDLKNIFSLKEKNTDKEVQAAFSKNDVTKCVGEVSDLPLDKKNIWTFVDERIKSYLNKDEANVNYEASCVNMEKQHSKLEIRLPNCQDSLDGVFSLSTSHRESRLNMSLTVPKSVSVNENCGLLTDTVAHGEERITKCDGKDLRQTRGTMTDVVFCRSCSKSGNFTFEGGTNQKCRNEVSGGRLVSGLEGATDTDIRDVIDLNKPNSRLQLDAHLKPHEKMSWLEEVSEGPNCHMDSEACYKAPNGEAKVENIKTISEGTMTENICINELRGLNTGTVSGDNRKCSSYCGSIAEGSVLPTGQNYSTTHSLQKFTTNNFVASKECDCEVSPSASTSTNVYSREKIGDGCTKSTMTNIVREPEAVKLLAAELFKEVESKVESFMSKMATYCFLIGQQHENHNCKDKTGQTNVSKCTPVNTTSKLGDRSTDKNQLNIGKSGLMSLVSPTDSLNMDSCSRLISDDQNPKRSEHAEELESSILSGNNKPKSEKKNERNLASPYGKSKPMRDHSGGKVYRSDGFKKLVTSRSLSRKNIVCGPRSKKRNVSDLTHALKNDQIRQNCESKGYFKKSVTSIELNRRKNVFKARESIIIMPTRKEDQNLDSTGSNIHISTVQLDRPSITCDTPSKGVLTSSNLELHDIYCQGSSNSCVKLQATGKDKTECTSCTNNVENKFWVEMQKTGVMTKGRTSSCAENSSTDETSSFIALDIPYYETDNMSDGEVGYLCTSNSYSSGEIKPRDKRETDSNSSLPPVED